MTIAYVAIAFAALAFVGWMAWELTHPLDASDEHNEAVEFRNTSNPH